MNNGGAVGFIGRWLRLILLALLCVSGAQLASMGCAFAHASLTRAVPADGAVVATAPKSFILTFSEPVSPLVLKLIRPDGIATSLDRFVLRDAVLEIETPSDLGPGAHILNWRIVSEDGHPVGGAVVFSIGASNSGASPVAVETFNWPVRIAIWGARFTLYGGLFIGVGGVFFANWIGGRFPLATRVAFWTISLALLATPVSVGLQGLDALDASLGHMGEASVWKAGGATSYAMTALVAEASLVAALIAIFASGGVGRTLSLLALLGSGLAFAASGHASVAHPQWLMRSAVFLHVVGVAFWAGALIPLGEACATRGPDAAVVLRRFSKTILLAVLPLVAAGMVLALIQSGAVDALWRTAYGKVLAAKLILLAILFLLAVINRFRLTEPAERGDLSAIAWLRRSIRIEVVLVLTVFAVAALWRFTPPPRTLAAGAAPSASVHIQTGRATAELTIAPECAGRASASIMIATGDFKPIEAKDVTLVLTNPAAGIEQIKRQTIRSSDGVWRVDGLNLPIAGRWSVRIDILISDFEMAKLEDTIDIQPMTCAERPIPPHRQ